MISAWAHSVMASGHTGVTLLLAQNELPGLRDAQTIILSPVLKNNFTLSSHQFAHEISRERTALLGSACPPHRSRYWCFSLF